MELLYSKEGKNPSLMADGRHFHVPHSDFLSMSPVGRTAVVYHPDGSASIVDLLLMTELEVSPAATSRA